MKKIILYCVFLGSVAFLPVRPDSLRPDTFTRRYHQFSFQLFHAVLQQDTGSMNKLISPLNIYLIAAMLYNGAAHATRDSIAEVLQAEDGSIDAGSLNAQCKMFMQKLPLEDNEVQFSIANSIWYNRKRVTILPDFETIADQYYYSSVEALNLNNHDATAEINQWVDQNTHHQIPAIIDHTHPDDDIYLLGSLYFRGDWQHPFDLANTTPELFHLRDGNARAVPFMHKIAVTRTFSDTAFTMVELPFGEGGVYSLLVILPENNRQSVTEWAAGLDAERLDDAMTKMTNQSIDLYLPRWEYNYSIDDLGSIFTRLGMNIVMTTADEPDFSNMFQPVARTANGRRPAWISKAVQRTCIRMNENGMEAAAAESALVTIGGEPFHQAQRTIRADHPFLYMLMEKQQGLVLMTGIVNDPAQTDAGTAPAQPVPPRHKRRR